MSDKITITVAGGAGVGKTALATLLKNQLEIYGLKVTFTDPDGNELPCPTKIKKRLASMRQADVSVEIVEKQTVG